MPKVTHCNYIAQDFSARYYDEAVDLFESMFPGRVMVSKRDLARFFACSMSTVNRILKNTPAAYINTPGGIRVKKQYIINWMMGGAR